MVILSDKNINVNKILHRLVNTRIWSPENNGGIIIQYFMNKFFNVKDEYENTFSNSLE